ncbi:leucine-rich repeat domain-containing protein [uncultured Kriegella sp.]|uniref:leucine-rich repeat domain-containing protein n=1 Tax=uncultured Kriegella sp. TaxID=1798910 RepID=UPI0030D9D2E3|tara:strand:- start:3411 stop:6335 length:2925 start_codon:yes stop_codon:yes gene_type:complete
MAVGKLIKKDRYPGIRSFEAEDERLFYGRTNEIDDLFSLVVIKAHVVLFGKSGLGKSSLLKAGLGSILLKNQFFPIMIRVQDTDVSPIKMVLSELKPFIDEKKLEQFGGRSTNKIWEAVNACSFLDQNGNTVTPVLIFDQFEELFNHKIAERNQWASQLADLIEGRLPKDSIEALQQIPRKERTAAQLAWFKPPVLKILFAIRSDRMSELHQLRKEIPGILQNRYELKPLHAAQSGEAIEKPAALVGNEFTTTPFNYAPETLKEILSNLSNEAGEIESFQLQIVCQHVEKKVKEQESKGEQKIQATPDFIGGKEGILSILKNYYDNHITNLGSKNDQLAARKLLEEGLIADGRRIGVADAVVKGTFGISDELLGKLLESRLIRPENTRLGRTFEISHDTLVAPILEAYEKRRRAEERIAKQKELEEREQQLAKEQRKRMFYYKIAAFTGILSLVAIGAFVFAYIQWDKSKISEDIAKSSLEKVTAINAQNEKIINSFYFYGDSLALATKKDEYERTMYGFIDKEGEIRIDYSYTEATPFDDETGYAKVTSAGKKYLLLPDETKYLLADNLNGLNSEIEALDLKDNYLKSFSNSIFEYPQLKVLLLGNNMYEKIPPEIKELTNLQILNLTGNRLIGLPSQIENLEHLEQLELSGNKLEKLPPEIGKLTKLRRLMLFSNNLLDLPSQIGNLLDLESLDLGYNKLEKLPTEIATLVNIKELSLEHNVQLRFPSEIGNFLKLQELSLGGVKLKNFPPEIGSLGALKKLDLSSTLLEKLPPEVGKLKNLEALFLFGNKLRNLPHEIGKLAHLKRLNLDNNSLVMLPMEIGDLDSLNSLYLSDNELPEVPSEIGNLKNLEELWLNDNQLKSLPSGIGKLQKLQGLYLENNQLANLPNEIGNLSELRELRLYQNQLKVIPAEIGQLKELRELWLSNNELKSLPSEIGKLENLQQLDLIGNPISENEKDRIRKLLPHCEIDF